MALFWVVIRALGALAIVPVFRDRAQDWLFDILNCEVIALPDTDLLAFVLGLLRLACNVETVTARDGDYSPKR